MKDFEIKQLNAIHNHSLNYSLGLSLWSSAPLQQGAVTLQHKQEAEEDHSTQYPLCNVILFFIHSQIRPH